MHIIAYVYHWDRYTLWSLSLNERRKWVDIIMQQKEAEKEALEKK